MVKRIRVTCLGVACCVLALLCFLPASSLNGQLNRAVPAVVCQVLEMAYTVASSLPVAGYRDSELGKVARLQGQAGCAEDSLQSVAAIQADYLRTVHYLRIAELLRREQNPAAHVALTRAAESAREMRPGVGRVHALQAVAVGQAKAGDLSKALVTVNLIESDKERAWALHEIARAQAASGDTAGAMQTVALIGDDARRASALQAVAITLAETGDFFSAFGTVAHIADKAKRTEALGGIAVQQAKSGNVAGAQATVSTMAESGRDETLQEIAIALAKQGNTQEALPIAMQVRNPYLKAEALVEVAKAEARAGNCNAATTTLETAVRILQEQTPNYIRSLLLYEVSKVQADLRNIPAAVQTAQKINELRFRKLAWRHIAVAQAELGDISTALETLSSLELEPEERQISLASIAVAQARGGDTAGALETLAGLDESLWRARALKRIGLAQLEAGNVEGALEIAGSTNDPSARMVLMEEIARVKGSQGEQEAVLGWLEKEASPHVRVRTLLGLAIGVLERVESARED